MSARELYATDDTFREVADLLFGGGYEEVVAKANPDGSDLSARKKRERTEARIGYATNIVGIGAGLAATPGAFKAVGEKKFKLKNPGKEMPEKPPGKIGSLKSIQAAKKTLQKPKVAYGLALGGAGLQVGNLAGDAIANRVLARSAKKDPNIKGGTQTAVRETRKKVDQKIGKRLVPISKKRGKAAEFAFATTVQADDANRVRGRLKKVKRKIKKSAEFDVKWEGEISKVNADKQQVFGWASIVEMNGEPVVDLQGDYISIDEVEKSAYDYVHKSRKGGDMHLRDGDEPVHASDMIESFVVTPEKKKALGLPDETPTGWWVGYQVNDPEVWAKVKNGERTGFSIHGRGMRTPA